MNCVYCTRQFSFQACRLQNKRQPKICLNFHDILLEIPKKSERTEENAFTDILMLYVWHIWTRVKNKFLAKNGSHVQSQSIQLFCYARANSYWIGFKFIHVYTLLASSVCCWWWNFGVEEVEQHRKKCRSGRWNEIIQKCIQSTCFLWIGIYVCVDSCALACY